MPAILLVDDNLDQLEMRQMILEREGFEVIVAASAAEALARCPPDAQAVVMDLRLPTLAEGRLLIGAIRSLLPRVCLIVLAGFPEELASHPEAAQVDHLLRKGGGTGALLRLLPAPAGR